MNNKVPVVQTAVEAFVFAFQNFGSILRIGWFPVFLAIALLLGALASMATGVLALHEAVIVHPEFMVVPAPMLDSAVAFIDRLPLPLFTAPEAIPAQALAFGGFTGTLLLFIAAPMALMPIQTLLYEVSGGRRGWPGGILFFRFGMRELKLLFAHYMVGVGAAAFTSAIIPPLFLLGFFGASTLEPVIMVGTLVLCYGLFFLGLIWFSLRSIAIPAAVAAENRLMFIEAFKATGGNVWRIFFALVVISIMLVVLQAIAVVVLVALGATIAYVPQAVAVFVGLVITLLAIAAFIVVMTIEVAFVGRIWSAVRGKVMDEDEPSPADAVFAEEAEKSDFSEDFANDGYDPASVSGEAPAPVSTMARESDAPMTRAFADAPAARSAAPAEEPAEKRSIGFMRSRFR
jgi:hypothetical protein